MRDQHGSINRKTFRAARFAILLSCLAVTLVYVGLMVACVFAGLFL